MDKNLRYAIEILFHRTSPVKILNDYSNNNGNDYYYMSGLNKDFERHMRMEYGFLSIDEIHNAAIALKKECGSEEYLHCGLFTLVFEFAKKTLWEHNGQPCVKFDQLLCYRDTTHTIGSDLFISAYLAQKDYFNNLGRRRDFNYPASISTDNIRLHNMLKDGLAENHFHLKGSTPTFMLSWICLMNNVRNRKNKFDKLNLKETSLNSDMLFADMQHGESYYCLVMKASAIRLFLIKRLNEEYQEDFNHMSIDELIDLLCYDDLETSNHIHRIQREIDSYGHMYGSKIKRYNAYMDYAIENTSLDEQSCIVFTGERQFLYNMFYAIISNDKKIIPYIDLFYAYLLISSWFRGELIQNNDRAGFANFAEYQDRKEIFIEGYSNYENALISIALESNLEKEYIRSIEARFVPKKRSRDIRAQVALFDRHVNIPSTTQGINIFVGTQESDERRVLDQRKRYFYVAHFPKRVDDDYKELKCKHDSLRNDVKIQAISISNIRNQQMEAAYRLYGIDACANEIGCRPEVFAQSFRFLKNHNVRRNPLVFDREVPQQLRITYHAGEDFLDVADGLRAIDEAIDFLDMTPGDRLGHALALGINATMWYKSKNNRIILPRQDIIDNAAWMIYKLSKYGYSNKPVIYELRSIYKENFLYIYRQEGDFQERDHFINEDIYIDSWKLRGDNPYLYKDTNDHDEYENRIKNSHLYTLLEYDCFEKNRPYDKSLTTIREDNVQAYKLMHHYHFTETVRKYGAECIEHEVSAQYIQAVEFIQEKMRYELAQKGIGIECNPSSNYLIGTFKRYDQHPITNFNNHGLSSDEKNAKMFISINTDDLGVFDTSLENEYALMACALQKVEDEEGNKKYNPNDIFDYLDYVRKMGITQSFMYDSLRE